MTADIERMARAAGMRPYQEQSPGIDGALGDWGALARFAALVRARSMQDAVDVCESLAEVIAASSIGVRKSAGINTAHSCAAAIRALATQAAAQSPQAAP